MFRVSFMVEDRKLAETLRPLAGKTFNMEVTPVEGFPALTAGPKHTNGVSAGERKIVKDWSAFPLPKKGAQFNAEELKARMVQFGLKPGSIYYARIKLGELGLIKKVKEAKGQPGGDIYQVM